VSTNEIDGWRNNIFWCQAPNARELSAKINRHPPTPQIHHQINKIFGAD